ncbi:MAG: hypothetical protein WBQ86_18740 [Candidatus Binatus sp.]
MQSDTFRSRVKRTETAHRVIWLAFIAAVPVYVAVATGSLVRLPSVRHPAPISFTISIVILSLLTAVLAPFVSSLLLPDSRLRQLLNRQPDPQASISPDEQRLLAIFPACFPGFLVRLALNEAIALYGLVLAVISRSFVAVLPFALVSFALNWMVPLPLDEALKRMASFGVKQGSMPTRP